MTVNAKKKRQRAREQAKIDNATKWCSVPGKVYGYHGHYTGKRCPKCVATA